MKFSIILTFLLYCLTITGQNMHTPVPHMEVGGKYILKLNSKGSKSFIIECQSVEYSDSTDYSCWKYYNVLCTAVGKDFDLNQLSIYHGKNTYSAFCDSISLIRKDDSRMISFRVRLRDSSSPGTNELYHKNSKLCTLDSIYDGSIYINNQKEKSKRIQEEYRRKQEEYIKSITPPEHNSPEFDLLPTNIMNYIGKVTREEFEKVVGPALDDEEGFLVYEVKNKYDNVITALRCFYRESDGKLISIKFPTPHYLGYWIDFTHIEGFPKKQSIAEKKGLWVSKRDVFNEIYQVNLKLNSFGCQIMSIKRHSNYTSAVINYHVVK